MTIWWQYYIQPGVYLTFVNVWNITINAKYIKITHMQNIRVAVNACEWVETGLTPVQTKKVSFTCHRKICNFTIIPDVMHYDFFFFSADPVFLKLGPEEFDGGVIFSHFTTTVDLKKQTTVIKMQNFSFSLRVFT